jgi:large subunit ribosomal protein L15
MKLHDLKPADGSRTARHRVGRGIAAGQGKTAGRGTKGQKARAGGSIPPWFEGGQTPLHMRIPKLRGFKNRLKIEYEIVNVGRIAELAQLGAFEAGEAAGGKKSAKAAPITVNQEILRAVGLVRTLDKPMKVLGQGDIEVALFVVADAFSKSAVSKIEAAGGSVQALEVPTRAMPALGLEPAAKAEPVEPAETVVAVEAAAEAPARAAGPRTAKPKAAKPKAAKRTADPGEEADAPAGDDTTAAPTDEPVAEASVEVPDEPLTDDAAAGEDA